MSTSPVRVRPPAVAGTFYPSDGAELARHVDQLVAGASCPDTAAPLRALVLPHAGYVYSGPIAATGYALLARRAAATATRRVVLLGPSHRAPVRGLALPEADAFAYYAVAA